MNTAATVQRQLDAYNAHDLERFVAEYATDVFRAPGGSPVLPDLQANAVEAVAVYKVVDGKLRAVWFF